MMGSRGRSGAKQISKRSNTSNQRSGLLQSSSDGIEGSCSSSSQSSGSVGDSAYLHQKASKNQVQYLSPDGSVFTIGANQFPSRANQHPASHNQHLAFLQQTSMPALANGSPSSPIVANLDPMISQKQSTSDKTAGINQRQQQHQRLQYQVHQKLQRIYGNNIERNSLAANQRQPTDRSNQFSMFNKHKQQANEVADREQQFRSSVMKNSGLIMLNNQSREQQEQTYDSLSPASIPHHPKQQLNEGFYSRDSNLQRHQAISAIPEECDDIQEGELLIPEVSASGNSSKRAAIDRKNQLEDLHYATATAAALLSATASAAAAFAATEKQFNRPDELTRCNHQQQVDQQNLVNSIYSDSYQEDRKNVHHQQHQRCTDSDPDTSMALLFKQQQQQNLQRTPIYADAIDSVDFMQANERHLHLAKATNSSSAIYSPITRANMGQSQIYSLLPSNYPSYQAPNFNRAIPPQPPARRMLNRRQIVGASHNSVQVDLLRQHQHQQRLMQQRAQLQQQAAHSAPAPVPTLAILHHGKGPSSSKADLINRLLVNNIMAAQRADATQYMSSAAATAINRSAGSIGGLASKLVDNHYAGQVAGLHDRDRIYRQAFPGPVFSVAGPNGIAPSDSSGHSNVPLVLDRELKPLSFIERICRIDLTLFWWSLLVVSFIFMGVIFTISRYIF